MEVLQTIAPADLCVGFLTVVQEAQAYLGGYLVTNSWGRPLEFRLTTAVQPNRIQQLLYGSTLRGYICADLIGQTLVEKASTPVQMILTDQESILELRRSVATPIGWIDGATDSVRARPGYETDAEKIGDLLAGIGGAIDLAEPFARIREAIAEARKMGATARG